MAQNDIGIDLGTTTIIIAQAGQGVVLNQPSVVAMDTRKNSVLEVGDKALAMVGRTPNYISAIFPLKDGVISDHTMTRELICRFVNQVYSSPSLGNRDRSDRIRTSDHFLFFQTSENVPGPLHADS